MLNLSVNSFNHFDHNIANILKNSLSCSSYSITDINEILKTFGIIDTMFNTISNAKIR